MPTGSSSTGTTSRTGADQPPGLAGPAIDAARLRVAVLRLSRRLRKHDLAGLTPSQLSTLAYVGVSGPVRLGTVTPAGRDALERIRAEGTSMLAEILRTLPPDQLAALEAALPALERLGGSG